LTEQSLGTVLTLSKSSPNVHLDWSPYASNGNTYIVRRKQVVDPSDKSFTGALAIASTTDPTESFDDPVLADGNRYDYRVFKRIETDALFYYHTDHLGTPVAMTDGSSTFVWRAEYLPFGGLFSNSVATVANNLRFPGQYVDAETGLHQNWFRDYAPNTGRYARTDPLGLFTDLNPFAYSALSPIKLVDPSGLWGIQFGWNGTNLGAGHPTMIFTWDSWGDLARGAAATADGIIPFWDPFERFYADKCGTVDFSYKLSRHVAGFSRDLLLSAGIPNIGTWAKNPLLYEIGQKTLPVAVFESLEDLTAIERGREIVAQQGWLRAIRPALNPFAYSNTVGTGLTPGAWLTVLGLFEGVDYQTRK
jgi:RHS repeat-associated protein